LRTCPSCGKANNPIRKYCVRCGKSLLILKGDESGKKPSAPVKQPEIVEKPELGTMKKGAVRPAADGLSVTTNDQWVKPSQVQRERMRTTSSSRGKSEMEKAKEAFARAEKIGIQDEEGDIVETRMLRASEVREFMQDVSTQPQPSPQPAQSPPSQYPQRAVEKPIERPSTPPMKPASGIPPGGPVGAPPVHAPPSPAVNSAVPIETRSVQKIESVPPQKPSPVVKHHKDVTPAAKAAPQIAPPRPAEIPSRQVSEVQTREMDAILGCIAHSEDLQDNKIKDLLNELTNLHTEMQQVTANQISITTQLDTRVHESQNKAEVKRIHYESINEQLRLAKQDWDDARSEYDKAENRRKRELSTLDDRVKNIQKRIDKAEGSVKKRVGELDKVREKIAQLQNQES
jgi:hypothetical protein